LTQKKILILGASFSYLGCIKAAKEMGCKVLVADRDPNALGLRYADIPLHAGITNIEKCIQLARQHRIDGVVAVNDFGVMTAARISEELNIPGLPPEVAKIATNKYLMRKVWDEQHIPSVPFARVMNYTEYREAIERLSFPLILKPCISFGGCRGVIHIDDNSEIDKAYAFATRFYDDQSLIVERFVSGLEHSVEAIVHEGECYVIAISDNVKSPLPYRVNDTILYPTVETNGRQKSIEQAVVDAIKAIGMEEGIAHVELSMTDQGPVLFELGARCGGGAPAPLVPYLCGVEEFKEAVRIALGEQPRNLFPLYTKACVIKFFYPEPGIVKRITGVQLAESLPGVLCLGLFVSEGSRVRPLRTCADRAGMVIAGAESRKEALKRAEEAVNTVTIETAAPD
jgi:biotin carboxylase